MESPQFRRARGSIFASEFGILRAKSLRVAELLEITKWGHKKPPGATKKSVRLDMAAVTQRVSAACKTILRGDAGLWINKGTLNRPTVRVANTT